MGALLDSTEIGVMLRMCRSVVVGGGLNLETSLVWLRECASAISHALDFAHCALGP